MEDNWLNPDLNDEFNPEDHDVEMDEIAKMHAMADMKEAQRQWAREQAEKFYKDFETLDIQTSIKSVLKMIRTSELKLSNVNLMLDNIITVFEESEEYEKCHMCLKIKEGIND